MSFCLSSKSGLKIKIGFQRIFILGNPGNYVPVSPFLCKLVLRLLKLTFPLLLLEVVLAKFELLFPLPRRWWNDPLPVCFSIDGLGDAQVMLMEVVGWTAMDEGDGEGVNGSSSSGWYSCFSISIVVPAASEMG